MAIQAVRPLVLVVDDEPVIADIVSRYLQQAGCDTGIAANGYEALHLALTRRPDLVVLDIMLPGIDGLEVMRRLRDDRNDILVILLTARGESIDRITGLRQGADDYLTKPFLPEELVARVEAVLRRRRAPPELSHLIAFDNIEIDETSHRVTVLDQAVSLTVLEFKLLLFFMRNPGQVFSREQLIERVWGFAFYTDTTTVTVHIRRLRRKIERDPTHPRWIETVWGVGYRFRQ
ncbi:MAG: response regulator transcription factor [Nocardioidaceae bacterium]|nr:response regulator transcription factor [Nocardioidaceae bacterium]